MPKGVYTDSRTSLGGGAYPLVVKGNRHDLALTHISHMAKKSQSNS